MSDGKINSNILPEVEEDIQHSDWKGAVLNFFERSAPGENSKKCKRMRSSHLLLNMFMLLSEPSCQLKRNMLATIYVDSNTLLHIFSYSPQYTYFLWSGLNGFIGYKQTSARSFEHIDSMISIATCHLFVSPIEQWDSFRIGFDQSATHNFMWDDLYNNQFNAAIQIIEENINWLWIW